MFENTVLKNDLTKMLLNCCTINYLQWVQHSLCEHKPKMLIFEKMKTIIENKIR